MVARAYLKSPFFVVIEDRITGEVTAADEKYFRSLEEAREHFDKMKSQDDHHVYLGEIGVFAADNDELKIDYMTFDTNNIEWWREVSPLNRLNKRGFGRAYTNNSYSTEYVPVAEYNWRL